MSAFVSWLVKHPGSATLSSMRIGDFFPAFFACIRCYLLKRIVAGIPSWATSSPASTVLGEPLQSARDVENRVHACLYSIQPTGHSYFCFIVS